MEGIKGAFVEEKRQPRRIYIRPQGTNKKINRIIKEVKKVRRVLGWPETMTCKVCYKKKVPIDKAILRQGINGRRGNYWMCRSHL